MVLFGDNHWDIGVGEDGWDVEAGNGCVWEERLLLSYLCVLIL